MFSYLPDRLMPPIDRSWRALSIGGIRLVWEWAEPSQLGSEYKFSSSYLGRLLLVLE